MQKQYTLILSSVENGNEKAVLNISISDNEYEGKIRLYNFAKKPDGILTLGILCNGQVLKSALKEDQKGVYAFSASNKISKETFTCAIVNVKNGNAKPILLGATNGQTAKTIDHALCENLSILDDKNLTVKKVEDALDKSEIDYDEEEKKEISRMISCELGGNDKCAECKYREAFFAGCETQTMSNTKIVKSNTAVEPEENFYDEIKEQLSVLFERYPEETFLNEIIPNSKWIKVDYENNGEYYVIGLIYENNNIKFICYGIPGEYTIKPPRELSDNAQWLPLDPEKPEDLGYWITYQDAKNGESIEVDVS